MRIFIILFVVVSFLSSSYAGLITPIPKDTKYDKEGAKIGKILFFDTMLSKDKKISCASCHNPSTGWADRRKRSIGVYGQKDRVQTPTILNSVFNFKFFWNGRADNFKEQINMTLHNKIEMKMDKVLIEKRVNSSKLYKKLYKSNNITYDMIVDSLKEFLKSKITPDSKFDKYIKKEIKLTNEEQKGLELFKKLGCITCHNGVNVGGNSFQKIGIIFKYKSCSDDRYSITKNIEDKCVYKVPTLRNIELTEPYFHDGSAKTLKEAIEKMGYYNLGYILNENEMDSIESFLKTLTGKQVN